MARPGLFWVVVDEHEELAQVVDASEGQKIMLASGTFAVIDRVEPPPAGAHLVQGTIRAHRALGI
jgi:hypothetical protein